MKLREVLNIFNPFASSGDRAGVLNNAEAASQWNNARHTTATLESQTPVRDLVAHFGDYGQELYQVAGTTARKTLALLSDMVMAPLALAANVVRFGADQLRFPPRVGIITTDKIAEWAGTPSRVIREARERLHSYLIGS